MTTVRSTKGWNITLWLLQGLLAAMNIMAGASKLFQPIDELSKMIPWTSEVSSGLVRFVGLAELAGGLGLLLPALLRIQPRLTALAALGLALVQVLAAVFHVSRGESAVIGMNILFAVLALFVYWGRTKKVPILPKAATQRA